MSNFDLEAFRCLPKSLKKSAYVDFILLLSGFKPALRINVSASQYAVLLKWCEIEKYSCSKRMAGNVCISNNTVDPNFILEIDNSYEAHELEFGQSLGYPDCCASFISKIGETNIDSFEQEIKDTWIFKGKFNLINPTNYTIGQALISHLPCTTTCLKSLTIATSVFLILKKYSDIPELAPQINWLKSLEMI